MDDPWTPDANNLDVICTAGMIVETTMYLFILFTSLVLFSFNVITNQIPLIYNQFNLERNKPKTMAPSAGQAYNWQLIVCVKQSISHKLRGDYTNLKWGFM